MDGKVRSVVVEIRGSCPMANGRIEWIAWRREVKLKS